ncbi:MAG TPA: formate dehydrogenase accessory sulfurtransferase FdhD [Woeseiaceae bacterium]|jgi:FdhD protein|nr:formate dehydrogenase accessory sulfurtransferase FdhD [Woeseiaceae bacterium]
MASSSHAIKINKVGSSGREPTSDLVAAEEPLEIRIGLSLPGGPAVHSISVTMRTPGHDEALAAGFLFGESIIRGADDIAGIEPCGPAAPETGNRNVVHVELAEDVSVDLGRLQRHFYTTSSCGVCGKASLDAVRALGAGSIKARTTFPSSVLTRMPRALRAAQAVFEETGGLHAAAAFTTDGELIVTMEDVGRHNAVDKVIGSLLLDGRLPAADLGLMVSGRASFELMQKALVAGMPLLAAVSAPSSLAVSLAREFDMTLIGFLRGETFNIYSGEERVVS